MLHEEYANNDPQSIKIIECPRDAMQGIRTFIPTQLKATYINSLLNVGFDTLDFGSFVSHKAVPQMADTAEVLTLVNSSESPTKLLVIVANIRGAQEALMFDEIAYLGYPFSISETFQLRNTGKGTLESFEIVREIQKLCTEKNKRLVIYLSMAFGNPYGDHWDKHLVDDWAAKMVEMGIKVISLADTTSQAKSEDIEYVFDRLISNFPQTEFGAHFHSHVEDQWTKIHAAYENGCRRFDTAIGGWGGCPFAKDELVGNIATENLLSYCEQHGINVLINREIFNQSIDISHSVFEYQ